MKSHFFIKADSEFYNLYPNLIKDRGKDLNLEEIKSAITQLIPIIVIIGIIGNVYIRLLILAVRKLNGQENSDGRN